MFSYNAVSFRCSNHISLVFNFTNVRFACCLCVGYDRIVSLYYRPLTPTFSGKCHVLLARPPPILWPIAPVESRCAVCGSGLWKIAETAGWVLQGVGYGCRWKFSVYSILIYANSQHTGPFLGGNRMLTLCLGLVFCDVFGEVGIWRGQGGVLGLAIGGGGMYNQADGRIFPKR